MANQTVDQFRRRRQVRQILAAIAAIVLFVVLAVADRQGWLLHKTADWHKYEGEVFRVVRVIDGDTLDIDVEDGKFPATRIRLWGIDTPELARPREGLSADPFAEEAKAFARSFCEGRQVTLRLDVHQSRDRYDRLLAYIILPDGSMLNELLLLAGLARNESRFPHQHLERFDLLEKQARFEKKGIWGN